MKIEFWMLSAEDAKQIGAVAPSPANAGLSNDWELAEFLEGDAPDSWGLPIEALCEVRDGKFYRLVHVDYNAEPEDATLARSFSWVIKELNRLAKQLSDKEAVDAS